jgi:hypothetical protein
MQMAKEDSSGCVRGTCREVWHVATLADESTAVYAVCAVTRQNVQSRPRTSNLSFEPMPVQGLHCY